jgi:hypothetical protein
MVSRDVFRQRCEAVPFDEPLHEGLARRYRDRVMQHLLNPNLSQRPRPHQLGTFPRRKHQLAHEIAAVIATAIRLLRVVTMPSSFQHLLERRGTWAYRSSSSITPIRVMNCV